MLVTKFKKILFKILIILGPLIKVIYINMKTNKNG